MSSVAQGHVTDRPFARTVYAIAARRFTGDLVMTQGQQHYTVTWREGWVVAAASPSPADAPGRIALTSGLVTSTQLSQAVSAAQALGGDAAHGALDVLVADGRLTIEQAEWVRRQTLAHCAMRIFSLADGRFVLDDRPSLAQHPQAAPLHPRWVIYQGLRKYYDDARLAAELAALGDAPFRLSQGGAARLDDFGLEADAATCAESFRDARVTLRSLIASTKLGPSAVMALVYALLATDCLEVEGVDLRSAQGARSAPSGQGAHSSAQGARAASSERPSASPARPSPSPERPSPSPARTPPERSGSRAVAVNAMNAVTAARKPAAGPRRSPDAVRRLLAAKLGEIDAGCDHFGLLGVAPTATEAEIRTAYFALARQLHPDQLRRHAVTERPEDGQRVMAQLNLAFGVLSSPRKREAYRAELDAGAALAGPGDSADAEAQAVRLLDAERYFRQGEMALRRGQYAQAVDEFGQAVALNPDEAEHHALLAWATWCATEDKPRVLSEVQRSLRRALTLSPNNPKVFLFRGRVASQSGDVDQAIECFQRVLELRPSDKDAALELRVLQSRRDDNKPGLFSRFKRR